MPPLPTTSPLLTSASVSSDAFSYLPQDAVAASSHLQQFSAVRQPTRDLQRIKPRHPKRPQLPPGEAGTPTTRNLHTAAYKQSIPQYNYALKLNELYLNQILTEQAAEIDKIIQNVTTLVNHFTPPLNYVNLYLLSTIHSKYIL